MLINFELTPLIDVSPWGTRENHRLSWFGLTDGKYWIRAGESSLFEYSEHACSVGAARYCDYPVIRLLEDILAMLPSIMQAVPPALVQYLSGETGKKWQRRLADWSDEQFGVIDEDEYWRLVEQAESLSAPRFLDTAYLSPSTRILMWSDDESVHIEWDNSEKFIEGRLAWSALKGKFKMPRDEFVKEVESFHSRLIEQMALRVRQVVEGALSPDIFVDVPALLAEHEERRQAFTRAKEKPVTASWGDVASAIRTIAGEIPFDGH